MNAFRMASVPVTIGSPGGYNDASAEKYERNRSSASTVADHSRSR